MQGHQFDSQHHKKQQQKQKNPLDFTLIKSPPHVSQAIHLAAVQVKDLAPSLCPPLQNLYSIQYQVLSAIPSKQPRTSSPATTLVQAHNPLPIL
jgi:hypothetical protein